MRWYEITGLVVGVLASVEAARRTVWQSFRGLMRGAHAVAKFGKVLPDLSDLPSRMDRVEKKIDTARTEVRDYAETDQEAHKVLTQELRDHMGSEDAASLIHEKAWAALIATQHQMVATIGGLRSDMDTVRQISMNTLETGSGDRWRLTLLSEATEPPS